MEKHKHLIPIDFLLPPLTNYKKENKCLNCFPLFIPSTIFLLQNSVSCFHIAATKGPHSRSFLTWERLYKAKALLVLCYDSAHFFFFGQLQVTYFQCREVHLHKWLSRECSSMSGTTCNDRFFTFALTHTFNLRVVQTFDDVFAMLSITSFSIQ